MFSEKMRGQQLDADRSPRQMEIEGSSLQECKSRLSDKYGKNYDILNYETTLKPGFFGLFQKEVVRARYIVDDSFDSRFQSDWNRNSSSYLRTPQDLNSRSMPQKPYLSQQQAISKNVAGDSFSTNQEDLLKNLGGASSVASIKQMAQLAKQIEKFGEKLDSITERRVENNEHPSIEKIDELLVQNEFSPSFIKDINARIKSELTWEQLDDFDLVQQKVLQWIGESISIAPKFSKKGKQAHVLIIIGPTGVGKTTTVAKMAAMIRKTAKDRSKFSTETSEASSKKRNSDNVDIRMLTIDKMRVAAVEQLSHWAEIMGIDVDKVENSEDLQELFDSYKNKADYIFIDTSGFSPKDLENIAKLHKILDVEGMRADIYLAVTASTKLQDLENIIRNYEVFNFRSVIVTKCDETSTYGNVLSVLNKRKKSISWITDGQQVGLNTLKRANPIFFLKSLEGFSIDKKILEKTFGKVEES